MSKNLVITLAVFLLSVTALLACGSSGPPSAVVDVAAAEAESYFCDLGVECKDFRASQAEKLELSPADKANDIQEKWCINLAFVWRAGSGDWEDHDWQYLVVKLGGRWEAERGCW
jgi:hypothetical protein